MAVTMSKVNKMKENLAAGLCGNLFTGSTDVFKLVLTNAINLTTAKALSDVTQITGGGTTGYTTDGAVIAINTGGVVTGTYTLILATTPIVWTAGADTAGPFRYVVLYNSTPAGKPLLGSYDYGSSITLAAGETFTFTPAAGGEFTIV